MTIITRKLVDYTGDSLIDGIKLMKFDELEY